MKKTIGIIMLFTAVILTIVTIVGAVSSNRIDSWLDRAKDAGNPQQVAEFLTTYKQALYDAGRVEGKYLSIWKYPGGKMTIYIRAIDGLIKRASDLALQNSTDTSYQMGLVNLEKDLGDIETAAYSVWVASGGFWIVILMVTLWLTFWIPLLYTSLYATRRHQ